jgi:hypothetical protein
MLNDEAVFRSKSTIRLATFTCDSTMLLEALWRISMFISPRLMRDQALNATLYHKCIVCLIGLKLMYQRNVYI